ncbi:hypothetical protein SAMN05216215_1004170 [Saccharopolyspora shandongensis]|uniref:Uncharacterized protein n=1 Tax=Saccharopolyspora shandongensis TaxID=418495 RepID=A0A1H2V380_9PSEU|nr:hypothetical protein SAMN05216215_1004170 [Saccharopolyspora shandongensis]
MVRVLRSGRSGEFRLARGARRSASLGDSGLVLGEDIVSADGLSGEGVKSVKKTTVHNDPKAIGGTGTSGVRVSK